MSLALVLPSPASYRPSLAPSSRAFPFLPAFSPCRSPLSLPLAGLSLLPVTLPPSHLPPCTELDAFISAARNEWRQAASGVTVRIFYVDRSGRGMREVAPQQLMAAPNAATVEAAVGAEEGEVDAEVRGGGGGGP